MSPLSAVPIGVSTSVVKPELGSSTLELVEQSDQEIQIKLMVKNTGSLSASPTTVYLMLPDEFVYTSSSHKTGMLISDYARFYQRLRWDIPSLDPQETQSTNILLTIPKEQIGEFPEIAISAVFSAPNGAAVSIFRTLNLSSTKKKSTIKDISDLFKRLLFWWDLPV